LACLKYEELILNRGPIDVQILGIGRNGHIAFNEPGSSRFSRTRMVDLSEETIKDNSRFFDNINDVPRQALTMGIGTILETKEIILVANGKNKAEAVGKALEGSITEDLPASFLQDHPEVTFIVDEEAASSLSWLNLTKIFIEMAARKSSRVVSRMLS
jgi:glucosamine-6-phosphate deaminase